MKPTLKKIKKRLAKKEQIAFKIQKIYPFLKTPKEIEEFFEVDSLLELDSLEFEFFTSNEFDVNSFCSCLDRNGNIKTLYQTKKEALKHASSKDIIAYPCPSELGWHLSRK